MERLSAMAGITAWIMGTAVVSAADLPWQAVHQLDNCQQYEHMCLQVDVSDRKLTLYQQGKSIRTFDVAVGKPGWATPIGNHYVFEMGQDVAWLNLFTGEPSSDNPMLGKWIGYARYDNDVRVGFHPTAQLDSVGTAASHGCNRMRPEDFNELYSYVTQANTLVPVLVRQ